MTIAREQPCATYRVQLHEGWGFDAARSILPYLQKLGIDWLYLSPIFQARPGSAHGYDVVDTNRISEELGGEAAFTRLSDECRERGMGVLLDIVPNHMAACAQNRAWWDVLAHGRCARCANWFDIAWKDSGRAEPLALPMLGDALDEVVAAGEITIEFTGESYVCRYFEHVFPVEVGSVRGMVRAAVDRCDDESEPASELKKLLEREVPDWREFSLEQCDERYAYEDELRCRLSAAAAHSEDLRIMLERTAADASVREVLDSQPYRLTHWKDALREVSYRRFFDITHLIGVRVEDSDVFADTHQRIVELVKQGAVTGLRIDHIDGLADPLGYLRQLREACAPHSPYLVVEKILASDEQLEESWPVAGTTGYEFINAVSGMFVDRDGLRVLTEHFARLIDRSSSFEELMRSRKRRVAEELFSGEVAALVRSAADICERLRLKQPSEMAMREAIIATSAHLPVYRTYVRCEDVMSGRIAERDRALIEHAVAAAAQREDDESENVRDGFEALKRILLVDVPAFDDEQTINRIAAFIVKWQQFTGPLAAKGVEDTALYRDARLVSLNEVSADAETIERPGGVKAFHRHNALVAQRWPRTLTASSTHDTKRSEDVRTRLHVLSEIADEWTSALEEWRELNGSYRTIVEEVPAPDAAFESFLYQNIIGAWPLDKREMDGFAERMVAYAIKASREAKARTNWIEPCADYERAVEGFVRRILVGEWKHEAQRFIRRIGFAGALNSLGSVVLKIASPGIPDVYRGTELWDFSLVDPDNRRPVDFELHARLLDEIAAQGQQPDDDALREMATSWRDGRIKMFVTHRALRLRQKMRDVFLEGEYLPLHVRGERKYHVCAFARRHEGKLVIAIAAARVARMIGRDGAMLDERTWGDTGLELPADSPVRLRDSLTGREIDAERGTVHIAEALRYLPAALLTAQ